MAEIEKKGKIKGITLIALIITIIILLILAGVTIGAIGGNSGILIKAEKATAEWNKKAEEEQNAINEINKELAISSPKGNIQIEGIPMTPRNTQNIGIQNGVEAGPIIVKITYQVKEGESIYKEWSLGEKNEKGELIWQRVEEGNEKTIEITTPTTVYARLSNSLLEESDVVTLGINNIDNIAPNPFYPIVSKTTIDTITVTGSTTDTADEGSSNTISGVRGYQFSINDGAWTQEQVNNSYTFGNLSAGTTYHIKMKAIDKAGNETITNTISAQTLSLPDSKDITFTANIPNDQWTKENVIVTINWPQDIEGLTLQYRVLPVGTSQGEWKSDTSKVTITENATIEAKLKTESGQESGVASYKVTNIDKTAPASFTPTATSTSNSITLTGSTTDSGSGIKGYYFSKDDGATWTAIQSGTSYTFTDLTKNTTYKLRMKAEDNVGLIATTEAITKATSDIPGGDSNITFTPSPSGWTNGSVAVTVNWPTSNVPSGLTKQYKIGSSGTWTTYTAPITLTSNNTIYARYIDNTSQAGTTASINITNIDKTAPNAFNLTYTKTSNSITVTASTTDTGSGIAKYQYKIDNGTWQDSNKFTGLTTGSTHTISAKAIDKVGLQTEATNKDLSVTIDNITVPAITMTGSPTTPTNGNVTVKIQFGASGLTNQYKVGNGAWTNATTATGAYTQTITSSTNQTIYARYYDGTNTFGSKTYAVANIDKLAPNNFTPTATVTNNSITLTGSTTDAAKTATNASSGIKAYYFSKDNGATWLPTGGQTGTSYTFSGLASGTYSLKMKAVDNAGNIKISDMYKATINISKTESYVGYYADIDGDKTVDGIIYADLAKGNTGDGQWYDSDGNYTIPVTEGVKDYYISKTNYEGSFGTKDVLSPTGTGKDRFYIMALTDIDGKQNGTYYWYNAAYGNMSDYATATSGDFGTGKANTNAMIAKWDAKAYGEQDKSADYKDMWGQIKSQVAKGWFVPSRAEWSAFAEELGITKENYANKGLSIYYWSSSQRSKYVAWDAYFISGYMSSFNVNVGNFVRLSATF